MSVPRYEWQPTTFEVARRAGIPPEQVVRFDHNTSPFPTPWASTVSAELAARLNEYPPADYRALRQAAAATAGLPVDHVIAGAGVDELISLCAKAFLGPGRTAVVTPPTYTLYEIASRQSHGRVVQRPRPAPDFALPEAEVLAAAPTAEVIWLCVPSNPIGNRIEDHELESVLEASPGLVILDGAYAEFADDRWGSWVERFDNLVVLHTLSKAYGLAGIRVGYALARPELIATLDRVRPPGSISTLSAELALRALQQPERVKENVAAIVREREVLAGGLAGLGFRVLPSTTNFLLCEVGDQAASIAERLLSHGLVVRAFPHYGPLGNYLRFTVRVSAEHDRLLAVLAGIVA